MAILFYIIPAVLNEIGNSRGPKYLKWRQHDGLDVQWSAKDYGSIDIMIVAVNAEQVAHDFLLAQTDVYQFPENIEVNVPLASVNTLQSYLEVNGIPGDWTSPSQTWRITLRTITSMFLYMQRLRGVSGQNPLEWGYTLNTQWRNVTAIHKAGIVDAATSLGYDTGFMKNNTLIRAIIKTFADAWGAQPIYFGFVTL